MMEMLKRLEEEDQGDAFGGSDDEDEDGSGLASKLATIDIGKYSLCFLP
jgi:hypothetical protein